MKEYAREMGTRMQKARVRAGLTQEELACRINRSHFYVNKLERGITGASVEIILALCDSLGVSSDYLLRGKASSPSTEAMAEKLSALSAHKLEIADRMIDCILALSEDENF